MRMNAKELDALVNAVVRGFVEVEDGNDEWSYVANNQVSLQPILLNKDGEEIETPVFQFSSGVLDIETGEYENQYFTEPTRAKEHDSCFINSSDRSEVLAHYKAINRTLATVSLKLANELKPVPEGHYGASYRSFVVEL